MTKDDARFTVDREGHVTDEESAAGSATDYNRATQTAKHTDTSPTPYGNQRVTQGSNPFDTIATVIRTIVFLIVVFSIYRFGVGWFSYDTQFQEIRKTCVQETSVPQVPAVNDSPLKLSLNFSGTLKVSKYCTCLSDHAKQYVSRFEVAIAVGSYGRIGRFDRAKLVKSVSMQNEAKICSPILRE